MESSDYLLKLSSQLEDINKKNASEISFHYLDIYDYPQEFRNLIVAVNQTIEIGEIKTKEEQSHTKMIHDIINSGMWGIGFDERGSINSVSYSPDFRSLIGFTNQEDFPDEYMSWFSRVHPDDKVAVSKNFMAATSGGDGDRIYEVEYRLLTKQNEYRWFRSSGKVSFRRDGTPYFFNGSFVDITSEKRNEKLLNVIKALCKDYVGVFEVNVNDNTFDSYIFSKSVYESDNIFNSKYTWDHVIEYYAHSYITSVYREDFLNIFRSENLKKNLEHQRSYEYEFKIMEEEDIHFYLFKAVKLRDFITSGLVVVGIQDVTNIREEEHRRQAELEEALTQSQYASEAKSRFLSNMSHDMRTPMNAIIGFTNLAKVHISDQEKVLEYIDKVSDSSNVLLNLINDILDRSRIENGQLILNNQECNLSDMVHELVNMLQNQVKNKKLGFYINNFNIQNEDIFADKLKLSQIFVNILTNAVKYTPSGGFIIFKIEETSSPQQGKRRYIFRISDNGIGMAPEFIEHIFEPFEREKSATISGIQGTGLGMSITKSLVDLMGGTIEVNSEKNKGSEFKVVLDLLVINREKKSDVIEDLKGQKVLVVHKDYSTCTTISKMLSDIGFTAEWTVSETNSIDRVMECSKDKPFDCIILEYDNHVSNMEYILDEYIKYNKDCKIILTCYDKTEIDKSIFTGRTLAFLPEPIFMSDLQESLMVAYGLLDDDEEASSSWTQENFEGKRILLVEDNELNMEIARSILEETGFEVEWAPDGSDAVRMVSDSQEYYYDAILMDIQMPTMNGFEATRIIRSFDREDSRKIPIFAMTANVMEEDKEEVIKNGMSGHIAKPIDIEKFLDTLKKFLH